MLVRWLVFYAQHGPVIHSFVVTHHAGVPIVMCRNSDKVDQNVVPKSSGLHELLIKEIHVISLGGHLGVQKLTHALFQRVWWPKLHETVSSFVHSCTICAQTKDSTAVPPGLLQPLPVQESRFSSWNIGFTIDLSHSNGLSTILTCVDHLIKYKILIPCKMGD